MATRKKKKRPVNVVDPKRAERFMAWANEQLASIRPTEGSEG